MIFDFRLRPPFAGMENSGIFNTAYASNMAGMWHTTIDQSVYEKSMDLLIQEMDKYGCTKGFVDYRYGNGQLDELVKQLEKYGDRFVASCGVDYLKKEESIALIDKYINNGPLVAVGVEPSLSTEPVSVDDEKLFYLYEKCQADNISIVMTANVTRPWHFSPDKIANVVSTFPKLKIILTHGCLPWQAQVINIMYFHENLYICADSYLMGGVGHRDFIDAANTVIPEQIIFGSSYPLGNIGAAIEYYKNCGFNEDVLDNVMYHNGMRALGLEPPSGRWHMEMYM